MNLKTMYPNYKIIIEEGDSDDPACYLIPGRLGHVYSWVAANSPQAQIALAQSQKD